MFFGWLMTFLAGLLAMAATHRLSNDAGLSVVVGFGLFFALCGIIATITSAAERINNRLGTVHNTLQGINLGVDQLPKRGYKAPE